MCDQQSLRSACAYTCQNAYCWKSRVTAHFSKTYALFTQVQLLVTASDVENYKQIKSDLDELRNLVEKSELWVFKDKKGDEPKKKKKSSEGKKVSYLNRVRR